MTANDLKIFGKKGDPCQECQNKKSCKKALYYLGLGPKECINVKKSEKRCWKKWRQQKWTQKSEFGGHNWNLDFRQLLDEQVSAEPWFFY